VVLIRERLLDLYIANNISYGFAKNFFRFSGRFS
jgi:hypothetical protein